MVKFSRSNFAVSIFLLIFSVFSTALAQDDSGGVQDFSTTDQFLDGPGRVLLPGPENYQPPAEVDRGGDDSIYNQDLSSEAYQPDDVLSEDFALSSSSVPMYAGVSSQEAEWTQRVVFFALGTLLLLLFPLLLFVTKKRLRTAENMYLVDPRLGQAMYQEKGREVSLRRRKNDLKPYYELLGLPEGASEEKVRESYKRLVKVFHSDKLDNVDLPEEVRALAAERFRKVKEAYSVLQAHFSGKRQ